MVQPQLLLKLVLTVSLLTRVTHSARETSVPCINLSAGDCEQVLIYMMSKNCATKKIVNIQAHCNTKPTMELYKSCVDSQCFNDDSQSNIDSSNTDKIHLKIAERIGKTVVNLWKITVENLWKIGHERGIDLTKENNAINSDTKAGPIQYTQKIFSRHDVHARKELSDRDPISSNTINQQNRKVRSLEGKNNGGGKSKIKNENDRNSNLQTRI